MLSNMKLKRSSYHRCYYHILIFIISHLWIGIDSESIPGYTIDVPHHVTVQRGLCVYIPCRFTVPGTKTLTKYAVGLWINMTSYIVASNRKINNQFLSNGRFFLVGDVSRTDCSLYIEDPLYEDEGHYRFRVEDNIKFNYGDIRPYVEVTDLKDKPEISPMKSWLDGEEVTLSCTFLRICPHINPRITWEGNNQNGRVQNWFQDHKNGTTTYFSELTFTASKEKNNSTLSCIVQVKEGLTTVQQITIKVEYSPRAQKIKCSMINKEANILSTSNCTMDANNTMYILEGSQLSLTCFADSVPESSLIWKSSNQTQNSSSIDILTFTNMSLTDEGFYTCQATNDHGTMETSVTIRITYSPRKIDGRISMCWKVEHHIECTCLIQSFPTPTVIWKINGEPVNNLTHMEFNISTVTSNSVTNSTLTIPVNVEESRDIQCVTSNEHGELVQELFNKTIYLTPKAFPAAAIYGGCLAGVLIVIGILLILFYKKRKMIKEKSRQSHASVADPIYSNSEMFSNNPNEVEPIPQKDNQSPPEIETVHLNCQDVQYMSVDFVKLKPKVATEEEEIEYAVVKRTN